MRDGEAALVGLNDGTRQIYAPRQGIGHQNNDKQNLQVLYVVRTQQFADILEHFVNAADGMINVRQPGADAPGSR
ncbi:hypothetical protein D3871_21280 [Noviherbaspirillum saxi]|uniref:Uncharacterized protein n=1 Tax=Noviherbaspirillum saxi TaxID=2320863 RepID=A0A3A3FL35_9BURK|nr:hypothetical protein D3871_21280 [Noviherbaspirillum saxi]